MEVIAHNFTVIIIPCVITNTRCDWSATGFWWSLMFWWWLWCSFCGASSSIWSVRYATLICHETQTCSRCDAPDSVYADGRRRHWISPMTLLTVSVKYRNCTKLLIIFSFTVFWRCVTIHLLPFWVPVSLPTLVCWWIDKLFSCTVFTQNHNMRLHKCTPAPLFQICRSPWI